MSNTPNLCVLHIGKTGGTFLRSVLRHNRRRWTRPIQLLRHSATLTSTLQDFGEDRQLAFTFRNPTERFTSGFYSRQRQGRPTFEFAWSAEEAAAFLWFETAEELALALVSPKDRQRSAAYFAFDAIQHLQSNLASFLVSAKTLKLSKRQIAACCDVKDLDAKLDDVMARFGMENYDMPPMPKRHAAPVAAPALSAEAEAALHKHWAQEYDIYEAASEIAREQGLSD